MDDGSQSLHRLPEALAVTAADRAVTDRAASTSNDAGDGGAGESGDGNYAGRFAGLAWAAR